MEPDQNGNENTLIQIGILPQWEWNTGKTHGNCHPRDADIRYPGSRDPNENAI